MALDTDGVGGPDRGHNVSFNFGKHVPTLDRAQRSAFADALTWYTEEANRPSTMSTALEQPAWPIPFHFHRPDSMTSRSMSRLSTCSRCGTESRRLPSKVPVPEWHREILNERLKDYEVDPDAGESWEIVRDRLLDKLRQR